MPLTAILGGCAEAGIAARLCDDLVINNGGTDYDDWFLPSKDELNQMNINLKQEAVGGFAPMDYWSSSEDTNNNAWKQLFSTGDQLVNGKNLTKYVRAARAY